MPRRGLLRRSRDFRLLWSGQTVSVLGRNIAGVAYPLMALALTHSAVAAGVIGLADMAPMAVLQLPAGLFVDRWNRRAVLLVADTGRAVVLGSVALLLVLDHLVFVDLLVAAIVEGSLYVPFRLAEFASLRRIVAPGDLPQAIALNQGTTHGTALAGSPLGGFLFALRPAFPFIADFASYGASLASLALIRTPLPAPEPESERDVVQELREGLNWTWHHPFIRSTALL
ncbi:MAG: MFS transporter, partial [Candidatus Dormibacteria bacterium]